MFQKLGLVAAMSSRASESALQCLVEELKLEAGTKRIRSLTGSHRASSVLHAECLQGCPTARHSSWKHSLLGTQILCFTVKNSRKKFAGLQPGPKKTVSTAKSLSLLHGPRVYRNRFFKTSPPNLLSCISSVVLSGKWACFTYWVFAF